MKKNTPHKNYSWIIYLCVGLFFNMMLWNPQAAAAPSPNLWPLWQANSPGSSIQLDHSPWNQILKKYLRTNHPSKINRFKYSEVSKADRQKLDKYLQEMQKVKVSGLNRQEQKAYWVNLYNSLTVKVVLDHYPVKSIMDIDISPGFFSNGPWDAKLLRISGKKLSLNDIEHRILRPIFRDNRLHYALNCASLGCPNLQPNTFTSANMESLLNSAAREYINSPRGAQMRKGRLYVSSIYKWFRVDFGDSERGVIKHLQKYATGDLANAIRNYKKGIKDDYNWNLNKI